MPLLVQGGFDYNNTCQKAHKALLNYNLEEARGLLKKERRRAPDNLIPVYLSEYLDFYRLISYESQDYYDTFEHLVDNRLNRLRKGPESSPFQTFARGEIQLHWAILQVKHGDWWSGGMDFYAAYQLFKKTHSQFPEFLPVKKSLLPIKGMIGTLPGAYQSIISLFGIDGDLQSTMDEYPTLLANMAKQDRWEAYHDEAKLFYGYMQLHLLNESTAAWKTIKEATRDYAKNPVSAFARANIALNNYKNDEVLTTLAPYQDKIPAIPHLDYLHGNALLNKLNPRAKHYLGRYVRQFKGNSYIKDAYLKMGWAYLIDGNTDFYDKCAYLVNNKAEPRRAVDKQAVKEVEKYNRSNIYLLKARLLFDGGYFKRALTQLIKAGNPPKTQKRAYTEYFYRLGRIRQNLNRETKAIQAFNKLKVLDKSTIYEYYLPASYYQLGVIHEKTEEKQKALNHYQQVLNFDDYPYQKSFNQKAKAGIERLE